VRRHRGQFDVIYSLSSNSFAALASGSFALAENYLFTTEAFEDYWAALDDDGFLMMEHQFFMPRLVASLLDALQALDVADPQDHFAVYDLPKLRRQVLLLSKRPLTDELRKTAFGELTAENFGDMHLLYPASPELADNLSARIVRAGWRAAAAAAPIRIAPCTDDRPFVGQMGCWKNVQWEKPARLVGLDVFGYPMSQLILVVILLVTLLVAVPLNLLPLLRRGPRLRAAPALYFFAIGAAFMSVEVVLIQKYTLFIGPSAASVATVLLTLLVASGLGSRWSGRVPTLVTFGGLLAWLLIEVLILRQVTNTLAGLPLAARIAVTVLLVAPLGFFMGMPFPKGAMCVGPLIDWGFAVNGAGSVCGATAILLVAMTWGLQTALLVAAALYGVAWLLLSYASRCVPPALEQARPR